MIIVTSLESFVERFGLLWEDGEVAADTIHTHGSWIFEDETAVMCDA